MYLANLLSLIILPPKAMTSPLRFFIGKHQQPGNLGSTNQENTNSQNENPCRPKCRQGLD